VFEHNAAAGQIMFDVLVDGATYISSNTGTALTNGIGAQHVTNAYDNNIHFSVLHEGLAAGVHNFKLRLRTAAGQITWLASGYLTQFRVVEG
jgi:hypothetical protein